MQEPLPMKATVRLNDWSIRPSGGALTVTGTAPDGLRHKVTRVRQIYGKAPAAYGYGRHGRDQVIVQLAEPI